MCMSCQLISTWIIKKRDNAVGHFYNQKKKSTKKQETQHYNSVPT